MVIIYLNVDYLISAVSPRTIPSTRAIADREESSVQSACLAFMMACIGNSVFVTSIHDATSCVGNGITPFPARFANLGRIVV